MSRSNSSCCNSDQHMSKIKIQRLSVDSISQNGPVTNDQTEQNEVQRNEFNELHQIDFGKVDSLLIQSEFEKTEMEQMTITASEEMSDLKPGQK